jgi:hypothetical protein
MNSRMVKMRYGYRTGLRDSPIALAAAVLLDLVRVGVGVTSFGKEARQVLFSCSCTVGKASVVAVSVLVGASHCPSSVRGSLLMSGQLRTSPNSLADRIGTNWGATQAMYTQMDGAGDKRGTYCC